MTLPLDNPGSTTAPDRVPPLPTASRRKLEAGSSFRSHLSQRPVESKEPEAPEQERVAPQADPPEGEATDESATALGDAAQDTGGNKDREQEIASGGTAPDADEHPDAIVLETAQTRDNQPAASQPESAPESDGLHQAVEIPTDEGTQTGDQISLAPARPEQTEVLPPRQREDDDRTRPLEVIPLTSDDVAQTDQPPEPTPTWTPGTEAALVDQQELPERRTRVEQPFSARRVVETRILDQALEPVAHTAPIQAESSDKPQGELTLTLHVEPLPEAAPQPAPVNEPSVPSTGSRFAEHLVGRTQARANDPAPEAAVDQNRFLQRVVRAFRSFDNQNGEVRLRLSPPELGSLRLEVKLQNGNLTARIESETNMARTLLLESLPVLRERLAEQGVRVENFEVDVPDRHPGNPSDRPAHQQDTDRRPSAGPGAEQHDKPSTASQEIDTAAQPVSNRQINIVI